MKRAAFSLMISVALLAAWWISLGVDTSSGSSSRHLFPLVTEAQQTDLRVAGITIEGLDQGERFVYVRQADRWVCPTVYGALALSQKIDTLLSGLIESWAQEVAPSEAADAYGINEGHPLRVLLHGERMADDPNFDVLLEWQIGRSLPGLGVGRSFVRTGETGPILEINTDARLLIVSADPERRLPPLLDERLLAGEWPQLGEGIERAFIDYADGRAIEVKSRVLGPAPSPDQPPPREWIAVEGERTARCLPYRIGGWQSFLYKVPYRGLSDPAAAERRGLDEPVAKITLVQVEGESIELTVGRSADSGATFVMNHRTGMLCLLQAQDVVLLLADVEQLCSTEVSNPWEDWLPR